MAKREKGHIVDVGLPRWGFPGHNEGPRDADILSLPAAYPLGSVGDLHTDTKAKRSVPLFDCHSNV